MSGLAGDHSIAPQDGAVGTVEGFLLAIQTGDVEQIRDLGSPRLLDAATDRAAEILDARSASPSNRRALVEALTEALGADRWSAAGTVSWDEPTALGGGHVAVQGAGADGTSLSFVVAVGFLSTLMASRVVAIGHDVDNPLGGLDG